MSGSDIALTPAANHDVVTRAIIITASDETTEAIAVSVSLATQVSLIWFNLFLFGVLLASRLLLKRAKMKVCI